MRGELITGQQLYHSPQSALTNYLTWSVKPSFSCEISSSLWFWQIPNYLEPCAAAGKFCFVAKPREKGSKQGRWYPSNWDQTSQTSKISTKSCTWKLRWLFLLTELAFPSLWQIPWSPFPLQEWICPWKGLPWGMLLDFVGISTGKEHVAENWGKTAQMALGGFALHVEELLNWQHYVTGETSCFCNYGDVCVCQETSNAAGLNWSN